MDWFNELKAKWEQCPVLDEEDSDRLFAEVERLRAVVEWVG